MGSARIVRTAEHRYFCGDVELLGVTSVLKAQGLSNFDAPWFTDFVRDRGGHVAAAIAYDVAGTLDEAALDPDLRPYLDAWRKYLRDTGADVEYCEQVVGDLSLGAAGTLDAVVRLPGQTVELQSGGYIRRTLIDVKLGLYPSVGPQTAAYVKLAGDDLYPGETVLWSRAALVLEPATETKYRLIQLDDRRDLRVFLAALEVLHWRKEHGDHRVSG